jgi:hypothetical protein
MLTETRIDGIGCLTSKMSHDHTGRDSCRETRLGLKFHFGKQRIARGMTSVVVGSSAWLGSALFHRRPSSEDLRIRPLAAAVEVCGNFGQGFRRTFDMPEMLPSAGAVVCDTNFRFPALKPRAHPNDIFGRRIVCVVREDRESRKRRHFLLPNVKDEPRPHWA